MNSHLTQIEDMAALALMKKLEEELRIDSTMILETVVKCSELLSQVYNNSLHISEEDANLISKKLEERFDISMSLGTLFSIETYRPWLDEYRGIIEWHYWDRYKRFLWQERYPPNVVTSFDSITDQILDHLENPRKEGRWERKGMVVGHVQSGKTANYIGLICKAADSGYRVIIVLAGMLNSLRNQTQGRLDIGFVGRNTLSKEEIGVGRISNKRNPAYFTTSTEDFKKSIANQIGVGIGDLKEPVILIIKKNKKTLENLIDWLRHNNPHNLKEHPMLLIDDEADHASINTSKEGEDAPAINKGIRQLIHLFERSSYLGYTATPFANVFIDPDTDDEMLGDDLFPRDFIISLDPPTNYIGPSRVFSENRDLNIVREIDDYEDFIPIKHNKLWEPVELPDSLKNAIRNFVLIRAIRILNGQTNSHNSMMINVSRFTDVQSSIRHLVDGFLKDELRPAISNHYRLNEKEALKNSELFKLKALFLGEFSDSGQEWEKIQPILKDAISPIGVIEVNSSSMAEQLDYSSRNYPNGRNVIAIGGLSLSRGMTLEGLSVSYFLRNSVMYDTLMQMGRWFGYRDGYADLCRIYMTPEASSWYQHISDVLEELREEFRLMKIVGMSPKDFGLCVRSHPESLIVTARNKMRTGKLVVRQVNLIGRLVETAQLLDTTKTITNNIESLCELIAQTKRYDQSAQYKTGYLWQQIPASYIVQFIKRFQNHPASQLTESEPLTCFIEWLCNEGNDRWDIVLVNPSHNPDSDIELDVSGCKVRAQKRKVTEGPGNSIVLNKHRVASRGLERAGLTNEQIAAAERQYKGRAENKGDDIPDWVYRTVEGRRPLLMLHVLDCRLISDATKPIFDKGIVAYGISFPGMPNGRRPEKLAEYVVTTTWWKNNYIDVIEEEGGVDDE